MSEHIEIVAEIGVNWQGSLSLAEGMILHATAAGCDSVKFQAFLPEHLPQGHPKEVALAAVTGNNAKILKSLAEGVGLDWFCTPFYPEAVDFLEEAGVKKYKIREMDARALISENGSASPVEPTSLIKRVLETSKPVYMSVQRKPLDNYFRYHPQISWLYCRPDYPARLEDLELWKCALGYGFSCHCPEPMAPVAAAAMVVSAKGAHTAKVIEVHVSNEPKADYVDGNVSFNFEELATITKRIRTIERMNLERPF